MPLIAEARDWEHSVSPWLWLPTISAESPRVSDGSRRVDGSRPDIGPTDYLKALNFALMLTGDMRKDIDFARPGSGPIAGSYGADLSGSGTTLAAGRTFVTTPNYYLDALVG
jgi:hypothetical protein